MTSPPLRTRYGLRGVRAIPELHAAEVGIGRAALAAIASAPIDSRIRYVSPLGPTRHADEHAQRPDAVDDRYSSRAAVRVAVRSRTSTGRSICTQGSPTIVVGTIDTGVGDVPDLAGKVDGRWNIAQDGTLTRRVPGGNDDRRGHGTAVASLIAANVDDGFGMAGLRRGVRT